MNSGGGIFGFVFFLCIFLDSTLEKQYFHFFSAVPPVCVHVCVCVCVHAGGVIIYTQGSVWKDDADASRRPSPRPPQRAVGAAAWGLQRRLHRARIRIGEPQTLNPKPLTPSPKPLRGGFTGLISDSVSLKPLTPSPEPLRGGFTGLVSDSVSLKP